MVLEPPVAGRTNVSSSYCAHRAEVGLEDEALTQEIRSIGEGICLTAKCPFRPVAGHSGKGAEYNHITSAEEMERTCIRLVERYNLGLEDDE